MSTTFKKLNEDWNAEPNAPEPRVEVDGSTVRVTFFANAFQFPEYDKGDLLQLEFRRCWRYRLGPTNDEGWALGQCRLGHRIPWGEFYELTGELLIDRANDWIPIGAPDRSSSHFLFYFRDETFECDAESWCLTRMKNDRLGDD